jgi:hypothetical protein
MNIDPFAVRCTFHRICLNLYIFTNQQYEHMDPILELMASECNRTAEAVRQFTTELLQQRPLTFSPSRGMGVVHDRGVSEPVNNTPPRSRL